MQDESRFGTRTRIHILMCTLLSLALFAFPSAAQIAGEVVSQTAIPISSVNGLSNIGDLDGDGIVDIAYTIVTSDILTIAFLNTDGTFSSTAQIGTGLGGLQADVDGTFFGYTTENIGDVDDDGVCDLAVGAPAADGGFIGGTQGYVHILLMNTNGTVKDETIIGEGLSGFTGPLGQTDEFGTAIAAVGDFDTDGVPDIMVSVPRSGTFGEIDSGGVWSLALNSDGTVKSEDFSPYLPGLTFFGEDNQFFGSSLASAGDRNGDGLQDVIVGAYGVDWINGMDSWGAAAVAYLKDSTGGLNLNSFHVHRPFECIPNVRSQFAYALDNIGDVDGDLIDDVAFGAPRDLGPTGDGGVYIHLLTQDGVYRALSEVKIASNTGGFSGVTGDSFGDSIAGLGDLDGDGLIEILVADSDCIWHLELGACSAVAVNSLDPANGYDAGGEVVTITADGMTHSADTTVLFGGVPSPSVTVYDTTGFRFVDAVTPAGAAGTVDVTVTNSCGSDVLAGSFTYDACLPFSVSAVTPTEGLSTGGTLVTITGTGLLQGNVNVDFGGTPMVVHGASTDTTLLVRTAAAPAAIVDVNVNSSCGSATIPGAFEFVENSIDDCQGSDVMNILRVNGSSIPFRQLSPSGSLAIVMGNPPANSNGSYVIHVTPGIPDESSLVALPFGLGQICHQILLTQGGNPSIVLNTIGRPNKIGATNYFGTPMADPPIAPAIALHRPSGDPANFLPGTYWTIIGLIHNRDSSASRNFSVTNSILLYFE